MFFLRSTIQTNRVSVARLDQSVKFMTQGGLTDDETKKKAPDQGAKGGEKRHGR
jgi:hypothetical protein